MSDGDSEQHYPANCHKIGGYQSERLGQQEREVVNIDDDDDDDDDDVEPMMDIDDEEDRGTSFLQSAVNYYQLERYQSAVVSFQSWRESLSNSDDLEALSAAADQALCRFRAETNVHLTNEVLYREAILANDRYAQRIQAMGRKDLLEAALLTSISAIWIHTKMNNLQMARHKAWDVLQWAVSIASAAVVEACTIEEAMVVLYLTLSQRSLTLRKFRQVLTILDLIEEKNVSKVLERSNAQKGNTADNRLSDQEEAANMLARHKLGMTSAAATASTNGTAYKVSVLLQAFKELTEPTANRSDIYENLRSVSDMCNPSDINLVACFKAKDECLQALDIFLKGLQYLRDDDIDLYREMLTNTADCLARLDNHNQASGIFMDSQSLVPKAPMQNAVLLGKLTAVPENEVLWRALISSSLDDNPVATLTIADKLDENHFSEATALVHVFSLSQAERPSLAKEKLSLRAHSHSHFVLSDEECLPTDAGKDYLEDGVVAECMHNNCGVVHARAGNTRAASLLFETSRCIFRSGKPWYLHHFYNLTLAYLQMGETAKAISLWERIRQLDSNKQKELRDRLQETAKELELGRDSKRPSRNTWTATGIGGLQPSSVHLLDCFVLRYRLQEMEEEALNDLVAS